MGALPSCQGVLVADAGHQVAQAGHPGAGLVCVGSDQVQGLHVVPVVHREAAGRLEAPLRVPVEDVRLMALRHFVQRINGD